MLSLEHFVDIMNTDYNDRYEGCDAVHGLKIIQKWIPSGGIAGAEHDIIYSVSVSDLIAAGITEEDTIELSKRGWMVQDEDYLACFV